jgi:SAM-dependent methyltransferase
MKCLWNLYARYYDAIVGLAPYHDMLDEVVAALHLAPGLRVLDAGCGTGALAERLAAACPGIELVGVDLSGSMIERARNRRPWPASFAEGDIDAALSQDGRGFDRIASVNVIWTLPDPQHTLSNMAAALREDGCMVHTTPRWRFGAHTVALAHLRRQKGRGFWRALAGLPLLGLAGLLNLVLVAQSVLSARGRAAGRRWHADGLVALMREAGAPATVVRPCYAGQGYLLVCEKERTPDGTWLPVRGERL